MDRGMAFLKKEKQIGEWSVVTRYQEILDICLLVAWLVR